MGQRLIICEYSKVGKGDYRYRETSLEERESKIQRRLKCLFVEQHVHHLGLTEYKIHYNTAG